MGNPMAKPFHIGSEFILSVVEGMLEVVTALLFYCSTFYSLAAKLVLSQAEGPRPLYLCTSLVRHSFNGSDCNFYPSCPKGATNYDKLCKTNPIGWRPKMNVNKVLTKDYENKRDWTPGENEPNSKPNKANFLKKSQNGRKHLFNKGL